MRGASPIWSKQMPLTKIRAGAYASGGVIQVQRTQFTGTNTISTTNNVWNVMTDLTVDITPTSTSSIIMLQFKILSNS